MHLRFFIPALLASVLLVGSTRADFQFEFAQGGTVGSSFNVGAGSTIAIQVYLLQTNGPTTNSTNLTANGLQTGGVALQYSSTGPFNVASSSAITPNSAFSGPNHTSLTTSGGTTSAVLQVDAGSISPVFAPTTGANAGAVLLGTFTFTGVTAGTGTTISALPNPTLANNVDGAGNNLDSLIQQSSAVINVTAVPEPGTLVLTGLLASGIAAGTWRRRRLSAKVAV